MNRAFSERNRKRCESPKGFNHSLDSWSGSDWMVAVFGELGEAANLQKKMNRVRDGIPGNKESYPQLQEKFANELADALRNSDTGAVSCQAHGVDLEEAVDRVFQAKSNEIGYVET